MVFANSAIEMISFLLAAWRPRAHLGIRLHSPLFEAPKPTRPVKLSNPSENTMESITNAYFAKII
jgi:hypothetical protein